MKATIVKYSILTIIFAIISCGILIATSLDIYERLGGMFLNALIPITLFFLIAVIINERFIIPSTILRQKYGLYCLISFLLANCVFYISLFYEYLTRSSLFIPQRIHNFKSPWILIDGFSNSLLMFLILLGLGIMYIYNVWRSEMENEEKISSELALYLKLIKDRLKPHFILNRIDEIYTSLKLDMTNTNKKILHLSSYLRQQLYDFPSPPASIYNEQYDHDFSAIANFLIGEKWHVARIILFQAILLFISFDTLFTAPDQPDFSYDNLLGGCGLFLFLNLISFINIKWLYRGFQRNHNIKVYLRNVTFLILSLVLPLIIIQILTYKQTVYTRNLPFFISFLATLSSMVTLILYISGVTAILLLKDWLHRQRWVIALKAETIRQEYIFLKKQINPHFLFNVLNNIDILTVDEPESAISMLEELKKLIEYQFDETEHNSTSLAKEIDFIFSYLALEGTRIKEFTFEIKADRSLGTLTIPTLLFIPFIENAVKHSSIINGARNVKISFSIREEYLEFKCTNSYREREKDMSKPGGIGLSNTLRRLDLLFGDSYSYSQSTSYSYYTVLLAIPLIR